MMNYFHMCTLISILVHLTSVNGNESLVYHIAPTISEKVCPEPCVTLHQLVSNITNFNSHNVTLFLLPGKHNLSVDFEVANMTHFIMTSLTSTAQIYCKNSTSFAIKQSQTIEISNVEFLGCGGNEFNNVYEVSINGTSFDGLNESRTALELIDTHAANIDNSTFISHNKGSLRNFKEQFESIRTIFGAQGFEVSDDYTWIGGTIIANRSNISIISSTFKNNRANVGGVLFVQSSSITIEKSTFIENKIDERYSQQILPDYISIGGVIYQEKSIVVLNNCNLSSNSARVGGILFALRGSFHTNNSSFSSNIARYGGTVFAAFAEVILCSQFNGNKAEYGGVLRSFNSDVLIQQSQFEGNNASFGGVILSFISNININESRFSHNKAVVAGSVVVAAATTITYYGSLVNSENSAAEFGVYYLSECNIVFLGNATFSNNHGALLAIYSNITFSGHVVFMNNTQPRTTTTVSFQDGGALSLFQSRAIFDGESRFENNVAENGGAIHSVESELNVIGTLILTNNKAKGGGGGLYIAQSELNCQPEGFLNISSNSAFHRGGGIQTISSTVRSISSRETNILFFNNSAKKGGGIYLETNAKLYVHKLAPINSGNKAVQFIGNSANYGGAIYVDDSTNSAVCTVKSSECFFRVVYNSYIIVAPNIATIHFEQNDAYGTGGSLFGGLLDRCIVSPFAKLNIYAINAYKLDINGVSYLSNVSSGINRSSISSLPTKLCQCVDNKPDCNYQQQNPIVVKKGRSFSVRLSAVDQIGNPVIATVQSILNFNESGLAEGQLTRNINAECTDLTFNIISPHNDEVLSLYASNGPCNDAELSTLYVKINFDPCYCPIGFQAFLLNADNCTCECHDRIKEYMTCNPFTESLMKQLPSNVWISFVNISNSSTGYLVFPNCPYGYCIAHQIPLNLNHLNGVDEQCAFNRSGLLCGSCQSGLSLSLGSSRCVHCPSYWPVVFILITVAAFLAGVIMVAVLLVLNMTVAVGTLNGLIFYMNIVEVNKSVLLPFEEQSFITVFVSWLNLELGIDTCYFPGLDAYIKLWIQLGFVAAYVVFLIAFIMIVVSSNSSRFTNLIRKKNPVATLSTLVFLSYTKLLELVFKALSFSIIDYPDGSASNVWLPDATVKYLQGKHIVLFITALLFLLIGLFFTLILFSWQWLLYLPNWKIFKWTRNQKLHTFIETYHAPYVHKHRYWTGMLLLVRAVLYFIAAVNVTNDPQVTLVAVFCTVGLVLMLKGFIGRLYRKWPVDVLETFFYFNLLVLCLFAGYYIDQKESYKPVAYISIVTTFMLLIFIIVFHLYKYTPIFSKMTQFGHKIKIIRLCLDKKPQTESNCLPHVEFLDHSVSTVEYNLTPSAQPELNIEISTTTSTETTTITTEPSCPEYEQQ